LQQVHIVFLHSPILGKPSPGEVGFSGVIHDPKLVISERPDSRASPRTVSPLAHRRRNRSGPIFSSAPSFGASGRAAEGSLLNFALQVDSNSLSPVPKKRTMHKSAAPSEIPVQLKLRTPAFLLAPIWEGRGPVLPAPYPARSFYSVCVQGGENVSTFLIPTCYRSSPGPSRSCSTP